MTQASAPPKPRTTPNPDTWFGRHDAAIKAIRTRFCGHPGTIVAWVVGVGGGTNEAGNRFEPAEHLEVADTLDKAGVSFTVHALDVSQEAIGRARGQLAQTNAKLNARHPEVRQPKKSNAKRTRTLRIRAHWRNRIVLHGPGVAGDIFLSKNIQRPDVITVFNVARSYHRRHQRRLARLLAEALKKGGLLLTNATDNQTAFVKALTKTLGEPIELGETHDEGKNGQIVAFTKTRDRPSA